MKKGISLIVLIITIIVILILTGAVILSFMDNNPIDSATEAAFKSDIANYNSALALYVASEIEVGANSTMVTTDSIDIAAADMANVNPTLNTKYSGKFCVVDGNLAYISSELTDTVQQGWLADLGVKAKSNPATIFPAP